VASVTSNVSGLVVHFAVIWAIGHTHGGVLRR